MVGLCLWNVLGKMKEPWQALINEIWSHKDFNPAIECFYGQLLISKAQTKLHRNTSQSVTYVLTTKTKLILFHHLTLQHYLP